MNNLAQNEIQTERGSSRLESRPAHRRRPLRVFFVHRDADAIESCLQELEKGQFTVKSDFVLNLAQFTEHLRFNSYDVVVVEYPSPSLKGPNALLLLRQSVGEIPLIFLTAGIGSASIAELAAQSNFEYVEREHIAQLPMAVRRVLNEKRLHSVLEEAEKALRHSQSLYRALADNPAYGVCRCDAGGKLLDVNQALVTMLGYEFKEELLAADRASQIVLDLGHGTPLAGSFPESARFQPIEREWKRKNGTILKVRLSGRDALDEHGEFNGREIIAVDVTEQRMIEEQLRHQASSDSLTALANHRRLLEVLHSEILRSKRTGREFSLLMLDLDGLKKVNDQFDHLAGDRALCRLGQILRDCCRSIDTAARYGGDEFAVVLPETGTAAAALVARRIFELLEAEAEQPPLSVSVGIASYPADADGIGTLLYAADKALYAMKSKNSRPLLAARQSG